MGDEGEKYKVKKFIPNRIKGASRSQTKSRTKIIPNLLFLLTSSIRMMSSSSLTFSFALSVFYIRISKYTVLSIWIRYHWLRSIPYLELIQYSILALFSQESGTVLLNPPIGLSVYDSITCLCFFISLFLFCP